MSRYKCSESALPLDVEEPVLLKELILLALGEREKDDDDDDRLWDRDLERDKE